MAVTGSAENISVENLFQIIKNIYDTDGFEGITISGGDPLEQLEDVLDLLERLRTLTDDILVYTGYVWDSFKKSLDRMTLGRIEKNISVLIDGPYIHEKNISGLSLRGSSNQNMIFFDYSKREVYEAYSKKGRQLQNIYLGEQWITVGIMDR
jgi:anaerobic ribonucleoside-triphosphate reductase activating protein